jgi:hypothetical protein
MKLSIRHISLLSLAACGFASAQSSDYLNTIRQVQMPDGVEWDNTSVAQSGSKLSELAINPFGARFGLYTQLRIAPYTEYFLDSRYVGSFVPVTQMSIQSEDTTWSQIPRTRADRPFIVHMVVSGLLPPGDGVPEAATKVQVNRYVQSYGIDGTDLNLDRTQAILHTQSMIEPNSLIGEDGTPETTLMADGTYSIRKTLKFALNSVPGADRTKVRGEERFTAFSLADIQAPIPQQLASQYIQIWPVADGSISGIAHNELIRFQLPSITLTANDLYPGSAVYAQVYKGEKRDNTVLREDAFLVPGSHKSNPTVVVPWSETLSIDEWDSVVTSDGRWTLELLTLTPFGIDRLAYVSFEVDRTIEMNGTFTTIE